MDIDKVFNENDRKIYEMEFREWLPEKIFDSHVHVFDAGNFNPGYVMPEKNCYQKFGGIFTIEQCMALVEILLPDQEFSMNCFGCPDADADLNAACRYTGSIVDNKRVFGMALVSPEDGIETVKHRIIDNGLVGYKPYRNFVQRLPAEEVTIFDMLSPEQLEFADEKGLAITLHIPKSARLADPVNQQQMVELCRRYPNAKIIFAHIGRAYYMENVIGNLGGIAKCPNAFIDTAMVNHPGVLEYAFNNFPRERDCFRQRRSDCFFTWKISGNQPSVRLLDGRKLCDRQLHIRCTWRRSIHNLFLRTIARHQRGGNKSLLDKT